MAAPHVSGAIALYLSANEGATYDQVYMALTNNVDTDTLSPPNESCGGIPNMQYPNHVYGYGLLNIFKAVTAPPPTCTNWLDDMEFSGNDVKAVSQRTADDCCDECYNTPNCNTFTFTQDNDCTCRLKAVSGLKHTKGSKTVATGAKAGLLPAPAIAKPPSCGAVESNVGFEDQDVALIWAGQAADCCAECQSN
ncbi:hypothetical protein DYB25_013842 [Aphanomyces astaci]|uniref:subtilisin n=2 Tax=Aphanomyces astaci TaxID=112090 RepID=A0A397EYB4_APHAT|nr:hypothetical protein DYB36_014233 [Aphanomyces astaci]RHY32172.1 hypothetical protein DYB25_013842 [Aphanomyces astaci]RHZ03269.1 hypothetical protein DYB31_013491 [Aphanomyces astaci]RHZ30095.1 hypothetical protein DYB26_005957 [Aphanomyces astaci]